MANVERLTKRLEKIEAWVEDNEAVGGPQSILDGVAILIHERKWHAENAQQLQAQFQQQRNLLMEFLSDHEMADSWDKWLQEKQDAVQDAKTEEVSVQEETESGEEAVEAPEEEKEG